MSLSDSQILPYLLYQLLCILNDIKTEYLPLANLIPIQWSPTLPTIKASKGDFFRLA